MNPNPTAAEESQEQDGFPSQLDISVLNQEHPEYAENKTLWANIKLLNEGGDALKQKADLFLLRRPKEPQDIYGERKKRFTYQPILGTIVGWYVGKMYQNEPEFSLMSGEVNLADEKADVKDTFWSDFLENCDRRGTCLTAFDREQFQDLLLYGKSVVLTDKPKADDPEAIETRADEQAAGLDRPYLVRFHPLDCINWSEDAFGNLEWVIIRCACMEQGSPWDKPKEMVRWYIYRENDYAIYEMETSDQATADDEKSKKATLKDSGPHVLAEQNRVPVRFLKVPENRWLAKRAYLHLVDYLDTENTYAWKLFISNLALLVVTGEPDLEKMQASEASWIHLPTAGSDMKYVEPASTTFQESRLRLENLREEIYRSFYLQAQGRTSGATPAAQSGYSKEIDMAPAMDVLDAFGDIRRQQLQLILGEDVADARGEDVEANVQGFEFSESPALKDIQLLEAAQNAGLTEMSPTLEKSLAKRAANSSVNDLDDETKQKIRVEIDAAPTAQKQAEMQRQQQMQTFQASFDKAANKGLMAAQEGAAAA